RHAALALGRRPGTVRLRLPDGDRAPDRPLPQPPGDGSPVGVRAAGRLRPGGDRPVRRRAHPRGHRWVDPRARAAHGLGRAHDPGRAAGVPAGLRRRRARASLSSRPGPGSGTWGGRPSCLWTTDGPPRADVPRWVPAHATREDAVDGGEDRTRRQAGGGAGGGGASGPEDVMTLRLIPTPEETPTPEDTPSPG